jgi:hypothetical protein
VSWLKGFFKEEFTPSKIFFFIKKRFWVYASRYAKFSFKFCEIMIFIFTDFLPFRKTPAMPEYFKTAYETTDTKGVEYEWNTHLKHVENRFKTHRIKRSFICLF